MLAFFALVQNTISMQSQNISIITSQSTIAKCLLPNVANTMVWFPHVFWQ
jgi:hypothetical protein